ncbi:MAG: hypothetical protein WAO19_04270 [Candidatus Kryptoniota bacterium]
MKLVLFSSILFSLIGLSCSSPLSDTNVADPSLLEPQLMVLKTINGDSRSVTYTCNIYDKNLNLVTLQNGNVKINGFQMNEQADIFGGEGYYLSGEAEVVFDTNKTFIFTLTLSDGSQYTGTVISQSKDLYQFNAPASQSHTQDITVSWKDTDPNSTMSVQMIYYWKADSSKGTGAQTFSISTPSTGTYTIKSSQFTVPQGTTYRVDLTLVSEKAGTIDSHFRPGSSAVSELSYLRSVTLN